MAEALLVSFRQNLPSELIDLLETQLADLENGSFASLLQSETSQILLGHKQNQTLDAVRLEDHKTWNDWIFHRLGLQLGVQSATETPAYRQHLMFLIGYAAFLPFIQSNVTGPPLPFTPSKLLFPPIIEQNAAQVANIRSSLIQGLSVDGIAAYGLTPNIELLCLADAIMTCPPILKNIPVARWAKLRISVIHQRLLSEISSTLQTEIYNDLELVQSTMSLDSADVRISFMLEKANIDTLHGYDKAARATLDESAQLRGFQFALTGALGKRTKFQQYDISQLVVLAKSAEEAADAAKLPIDITNDHPRGPQNLDLNDDTLLESISFSENPKSTTDVKDESSLPAALVALDPSNQPQLLPLDSIILLALASSITNTSPADGLTREETLPYATRVLEGGSSNWQIYTQALLVRSRIEGFKSRTIERGLLQLQALVDQVIAETSNSGTNASAASSDPKATSFLPKATETESASTPERLQYVFQLASPTRWELEGELAARWVQLGGLRSALEIYERLELWAEVALCLAATEQEGRARRMVRRQLFQASSSQANDADDDDMDKYEGAERLPPPADAPRLYCILGDIDQDPAMYEKAWYVSGQKYARAQRSLGRFYFSARNYVKAAEGYSKSLRINRLNHSSWFALGCALLELTQFPKAVEAFSRCVQLDEQDAEAWSNLAAALLRQEPEEQSSAHGHSTLDDEEESDQATETQDLERNKKDALRALKRAATLKHESFRIWENVLIVAASVSPPDYMSIVSAQKQLINLRGSTVGEKCIDEEIMRLMAQHIVSSGEPYDPSKPGFERLFVEMVDKQIVPLITASRALWQLVAKLAIWRNKPSSALEAEEKAWRAVSTQPGWETESESRWDEVVDATVELCESYESLGPREKSEGLGGGEGAVVAKDWKFKARSAIRGIMGRGKGSWEDSPGWTRLTDTMDGLKN